MNIKELLDKQNELDRVILEKAGIERYPFRDVKLALLTELGELANEWQGFKYWKKNKNVNREKLIEEWADCFHLALSLENRLKQTTKYILQDTDSILDKFKGKEINICKSFEQAYECILKEEIILPVIIVLGRYLGISYDEMEKAYLDKNKVNYERQEKGY